MGVLAPMNSEIQNLADEHRQWLSSFPEQHLANWERLFNTDEEAALTEAAVRRLLERNGVSVEPNEDLTGLEQRPDFRCFRDSALFYVEVTHISIAKACQTTGIDEQNTGVSAYRPLNNAVFEACRHKAKQCGGARGPVLLAIGTWHGFAAMVSFDKTTVSWLLTGEPKLSWRIDSVTGQQVGETHQVTELYSAAFLRPDDAQEIGFARSSIAGVLLVANGLESVKPIGVLHPNPANDFDPGLLPEIEFGRVELDRNSKQLHVRWLKEND